MTAKPLVSIIITTKNEAVNIGACINSIQKQSYENIEILVIDNNSSDATKEISKRAGVLVYDKGPERSVQRNFGAKIAKGQYVLFIDADMILLAKIVEECVRVIDQSIVDKKELIALVIPEISIGTGFWAQCKALERSFYVGVSWIEAARFYKKEAFNKLGGYDETLTGPEDFDIHQRLRDLYGNRAIGRISLLIHHNEGNLSLWKVMKKKFYYARNLKRYAKKVSNKGYYKKQADLFARYKIFFKNPFLLFRNPCIGLGMLILKTAEFGAGFSGYIYYSYFNRKLL